MFTLNDFRPGDRVELHPATDLWMRGARFGTVVSVGRLMLRVKLDRAPGLDKLVNPENIYAINP